MAHPECNTDAGTANPKCILPPLNTALQPTSFAADVTGFENWVEERTGVDLTLPMLKTARPGRCSRMASSTRWS